MGHKEIQEYRKILESSYKDLRAIDVDNIRRIHTLVISFSGAGLYVFFELLKFSYEHNDKLNPGHWTFWLKIAAIGFVIAVISSFIGLIISRFGHKKYLEYVKKRKEYYDQLLADKEVTFSDNEPDVKRLNCWINLFNYCSIVAMLVSIVLEVLCISFII
jgi:hypothetical protein